MATNSTKQATTKAPEKVEITYTVDEFAKASKKLNASPDIIRAAFSVAGIEKATVDEAKKIVNSFKTKEVK